VDLPQKKDLSYTTYCVNGDEYTGTWKNNKKDGKGTYRWKASGNIYDGDWKDDLRDGFGTLSTRMKNGTYRKLYVGGWSEGHKQGFGTRFYSDTVSYEGEWFCGKRHGWGRMTYPNQSIYEGEWICDKACGTGMTLYGDDHRYEGSFKDGKKDGAGKYFYTNKGQVFEGYWVDDVAKCGQMLDYNRESVPDPTPFPIPVLTLENSEAVLEEAVKQFVSPRKVPSTVTEDSDDDEL
jgi:hypothetical protein